MKCLLVDDERLARAELRRLLGEFPSLEIVGEATHVDEAVEQVARLEPDLMFLDIDMPGGTGFEVLERLETFRSSFSRPLTTRTQCGPSR